MPTPTIAVRRPSKTRLAWVIAVTCIVAVCGVPAAYAQDASAPPDLPADTSDAAAKGLGGSAGGDFTFGKLGEDFFLTVYLAASFAIDKLSFGIQVPLRIRVVDEDPQNDATIREEDWDEVSDYFRVIRYVQWSQPGDVFYIRVGEFTGATVGHGTMMNNYLNVVDIDHFQLGVDTEVNTAYGGGELVLDNVADPEIFGGRLYARPWAFVDRESYFNGWSVGTSLLTDIGAPDVIEEDIDGFPVVDDENNLQYRADAVSLWGLDTDFTVVDTEIVRVTPYIDNNFLFGRETGYGFHAGVLTALTFPADSGLNLRLEYQYLGAGYGPQYFDSLYEVQRVAYPSPGAYPAGVIPATKSQAIASIEDGVHGYLGQLGISILGLVNIAGQYRGSERPFDNNLLIQLVLPKVSKVQMGVVYGELGFEDIGDGFDPDGALFTAYARVNVYAFFDVIARFTRTWRLNNDPGSPDYGSYETIDEYGAGVGMSFEF